MKYNHVAMAGADQTHVLPLVPGALESAPAFYTNYVQCTVSSLDVKLTFCQRIQKEGVGVGDEKDEQALPTAVCYMSHAQFYSFVGMVGKQAMRLKEELEKAVAKKEEIGGSSQKP